MMNNQKEGPELAVTGGFIGIISAMLVYTLLSAATGSVRDILDVIRVLNTLIPVLPAGFAVFLGWSLYYRLSNTITAEDEKRYYQIAAHLVALGVYVGIFAWMYPMSDWAIYEAGIVLIAGGYMWSRGIVSWGVKIRNYTRA